MATLLSLMPLGEATAGNGAWLDGRDERLGALLERLSQPLSEVAAAAEGNEEHDRPEPTRLRCLEAMLTPPGSRLLVLTGSPWSAAALVAELQAALPDRRAGIQLWLPGRPEPAGGALVVAPYGCRPAGAYTDTVLYHPPYHRSQVPDGPVHLLWRREEWRLIEASLAWPYPDRDVLVALYKLLKAGQATPEALAAALGEAPGPWNELRLHAGLAVLAEIGLVDSAGLLLPQPTRGKLALESSARYQLGLRSRTLLADLARSDWPYAK